MSPMRTDSLLLSMVSVAVCNSHSMSVHFLILESHHHVHTTPSRICQRLSTRPLASHLSAIHQHHNDVDMAAELG